MKPAGHRADGHGPETPTIVSASNPRYRSLVELSSSARERARSARAVIEGTHLLQAWHARFGVGDGDGDGEGAAIEIFVSKTGRNVPEIAELLARFGWQATVLDDRLFARASTVEHGLGPLAIVPTPRPELPARLAQDAVYLDRIQDPGNVGSILRSCAAVGVGRVLASPGTAACWSPKVLRAGMGAHFHLQIHEDVDALTTLVRDGTVVRAADAGAGRSLYDTDLRERTLWLFGNEGQGLESGLRNWSAVQPVAIPQSAAVESLNVGVAAALCLYEQWRQRRPV